MTFASERLQLLPKEIIFFSFKMRVRLLTHPLCNRAHWCLLFSHLHLLSGHGEAVILSQLTPAASAS